MTADSWRTPDTVNFKIRQTVEVVAVEIICRSGLIVGNLDNAQAYHSVQGPLRADNVCLLCS